MIAGRIREALNRFESSPRAVFVAGSLLLAAQVALIHLRWIHTFFGNDDDFRSLARNNIPWEVLPQLFHPAFDISYRPVMELGFFLCLKAFGFHPEGFHAVSYAIHWLTTCMLFALGWRMLQSWVWGLLTALLFGSYFGYTEAVQWTSGNQNLFAGAATVGCLLAFMRWKETGRRGYFLASVCGYAVALLSKEESLALFILLIVCDRLLARNGARGRPGRWLIPFVLVTGVYLALAACTQWTALQNPLYQVSGNPVEELSLVQRLRFLAMFLSRVTFFRIGVLDLSMVFGVGLAAMWLSRRLSPVTWLAFWWLVLVSILPAALTGFHAISATRFYYLPAMPFCLMMTSALQQVFEQSVRGTLSLTKLVAALSVVGCLWWPESQSFDLTAPLLGALITTIAIALLVPKELHLVVISVALLLPQPVIWIARMFDLSQFEQLCVMGSLMALTWTWIRSGRLTFSDLMAMMLLTSVQSTGNISQPVWIAFVAVTLLWTRERRAGCLLPLALIPIIVLWGQRASSEGSFWQGEGARCMKDLRNISARFPNLDFDAKYFRESPPTTPSPPDRRDGKGPVRQGSGPAPET